MAKKSKPKIVEALYLGESSNFNGDVFQDFRFKDGSIHNWSGRKNVWSGTSYQVEKSGGVYLMARRPKEFEKPKLQMTSEERVKYEALKITVKAARLLKRKAMDIKRPHADIQKAIELLGPFARSLDLLDLDRFFKYIKKECVKPVRKNSKRQNEQTGS